MLLKVPYHLRRLEDLVRPPPFFFNQRRVCHQLHEHQEEIIYIRLKIVHAWKSTSQTGYPITSSEDESDAPEISEDAKGSGSEADPRISKQKHFLDHPVRSTPLPFLSASVVLSSSLKLPSA